MRRNQTQTLDVLTFNTWMLRTPFGVDIAQHVDERAALIPKKIAELSPDIVALQEVWDPDLRNALIEGFRREGYGYSAWRADLEPSHEMLAVTSLAAGFGPLLATQARRDPAVSRRDFLKHCALFAGGIGLNAWGAGNLMAGAFRRSMGNGLLIVSRHEIVGEVNQLRFSRHTRTDETLVVKGAIRATLNHPSLGAIDIFNSHLGAVSFENGNYSPSECADRLHQTRELIDWIRTERRARLAFLALDLNSDYRRFHEGRYQPQSSEEHALLKHDLGWIDSYRQVGITGGAEELTDDSNNPYKATGHFQNSPDCVIDFVFAAPHPALKAKTSRVVFREPLPAAASPALRLSDHYGVLSRFEIS